MAKKIAISLRKGGSGKTTTAVNLATALHKMSKKTLLVDLDPQANATVCVGINPLSLKKHINSLFTDTSVKTEKVIIKTSFGLLIFPSYPNLF